MKKVIFWLFGLCLLFAILVTDCTHNKKELECDPNLVGSECWIEPSCYNKAVNGTLPACPDCDSSNPEHKACYCNNQEEGARPCDNCDTTNTEHTCYKCNNTIVGEPPCTNCDITNPDHVNCFVCNDTISGQPPCPGCDYTNPVNNCYCNNITGPACDSSCLPQGCTVCDTTNPADSACFICNNSIPGISYCSDCDFTIPVNTLTPGDAYLHCYFSTCHKISAINNK